MAKSPELQDVQQMEPMERVRARDNIAIADKDHLKKWLLGSGRTYVVFRSDDLVDALPWPGGVESFMEIVDYYRDHRSTIDTGEIEMIEDPETQKMVEVPKMKSDSLEIDEKTRLIRKLISEITEVDSDWSLETYSA